MSEQPKDAPHGVPTVFANDTPGAPQSNAKDPIAVWMCPCGGLIQPGEETSSSMFCTCAKCEKRHRMCCQDYLYKGPPWDEFVRVTRRATLPEPSGLPAMVVGHKPKPEPSEHTTPSGITYVAEEAVPLCKESPA